MNRTLLLAISLLMLCPLSAHSQAYNDHNLQNPILMERLTKVDPTTTERPGTPVPARKTGKAWLTESFQETIFLLETMETTRTYLSVYDIEQDAFFLKDQDSIFLLPGEKIHSFITFVPEKNQHVYYLTARKFQDGNGEPLTGFLEVLVDGRLPLVRRTELLLKAPTYHVALGTGRRDYQLETQDRLFYITNHRALRLPRASKIAMLFGSDERFIQQFIKINRIDLSQEANLIEVFRYYNQLGQDKQE